MGDLCFMFARGQALRPGCQPGLRVNRSPRLAAAKRPSTCSGDENSYPGFDDGVEMHSRAAFRLLPCLCAWGLVGVSSVSRFVILDH